MQMTPMAERALAFRHAYPELVGTVQVIGEQCPPFVIGHSAKISPRHTEII
jgi:hypothetical protein